MVMERQELVVLLMDRQNAALAILDIIYQDRVAIGKLVHAATVVERQGRVVQLMFQLNAAHVILVIIYQVQVVI